MTIQELLDRIETIKDSLSDVDNRWGIEGACNDMSELMDNIQEDGINNQYRSIH